MTDEDMKDVAFLLAIASTASGLAFWWVSIEAAVWKAMAALALVMEILLGYVSG